MASNPIDCIKLHAPNLKLRVGKDEKSFKDIYEERIEGKSEAEQRQIATDIALEYHKQLHGELENFKKILDKKHTIKPYVSPDKSARIKEIKDEYQKQIDEARDEKLAELEGKKKPIPEKQSLKETDTKQKIRITPEVLEVMQEFGVDAQKANSINELRESADTEEEFAQGVRSIIEGKEAGTSMDDDASNISIEEQRVKRKLNNISQENVKEAILGVLNKTDNEVQSINKLFRDALEEDGLWDDMEYKGNMTPREHFENVEQRANKLFVEKIGLSLEDFNLIKLYNGVNNFPGTAYDYFWADKYEKRSKIFDKLGITKNDLDTITDNGRYNTPFGITNDIFENQELEDITVKEFIKHLSEKGISVPKNAFKKIPSKKLTKKILRELNTSQYDDINIETDLSGIKDEEVKPILDALKAAEVSEIPEMADALNAGIMEAKRTLQEATDKDGAKIVVWQMAPNLPPAGMNSMDALHQLGFGDAKHNTLWGVITGDEFTDQQRGMAAAYAAALRLLNNDNDNFIGKIFSRSSKNTKNLGKIRIMYNPGDNAPLMTASTNGHITINAYKLGQRIAKFRENGQGENSLFKWMEHALEEEVLHLATYKVSTEKEIEAVADELSDEEKIAVQEFYGRNITKLSKFELGAEYIRMALQEKIHGVTSEMFKPGMTKKGNPDKPGRRTVFSKLLAYLKNLFKNVSSPRAAEIIKRTEEFVSGKSVKEVIKNAVVIDEPTMQMHEKIDYGHSVLAINYDGIDTFVQRIDSEKTGSAWYEVKKMGENWEPISEVPLGYNHAEIIKTIMYGPAETEQAPVQEQKDEAKPVKTELEIMDEIKSLEELRDAALEDNEKTFVPGGETGQGNSYEVMLRRNKIYNDYGKKIENVLGSKNKKVSVQVAKRPAITKKEKMAAAPESKIMDVTKMTPIEYADYLSTLNPAQLKEIDPDENKVGFDYFEARESMPRKENNPDFKKVGENELFDYEYLANINGVPYGLSKGEDPNEPEKYPKKFNWIFTNMETGESVQSETSDNNIVLKEMIAHMKQQLENNAKEAGTSMDDESIDDKIKKLWGGKKKVSVGKGDDGKMKIRVRPSPLEEDPIGDFEIEFKDTIVQAVMLTHLGRDGSYEANPSEYERGEMKYKEAEERMVEIASDVFGRYNFDMALNYFVNKLRDENVSLPVKNILSRVLIRKFIGRPDIATMIRVKIDTALATNSAAALGTRVNQLKEDGTTTTSQKKKKPKTPAPAKINTKGMWDNVTEEQAEQLTNSVEGGTEILEAKAAMLAAINENAISEELEAELADATGAVVDLQQNIDDMKKQLREMKTTVDKKGSNLDKNVLKAKSEEAKNRLKMRYEDKKSLVEIYNYVQTKLKKICK